MVTHLLKKFSHPLRGIVYACMHDTGFRFQIGIGIIGGGICYFFLRPLSQTEILFLALAYALVLITELVNSSFEMALDKLHPGLHESIKHSKDMAAGAVLCAGFFLLFVVGVIALW